jgi:hypothetical protein
VTPGARGRGRSGSQALRAKRVSPAARSSRTARRGSLERFRSQLRPSPSSRRRARERPDRRVGVGCWLDRASIGRPRAAHPAGMPRPRSDRAAAGAAEAPSQPPSRGAESGHRSPPANARAAELLRHLAEQTGTTFTRPATRSSEVSREIARLKVRPTSSAAERRRERRAVQDAMATRASASSRRAEAATGSGSNCQVVAFSCKTPPSLYAGALTAGRARAIAAALRRCRRGGSASPGFSAAGSGAAGADEAVAQQQRSDPDEAGQ